MQLKKSESEEGYETLASFLCLTLCLFFLPLTRPSLSSPWLKDMAKGKRALSSIFLSQRFHYLILSSKHPLPPISFIPKWWIGHHHPKNATQRSQIRPPPMKPSALVSRSVVAGLEKTSHATNRSSRGGAWQTRASLLVFSFRFYR